MQEKFQAAVLDPAKKAAEVVQAKVSAYYKEMKAKTLKWLEDNVPLQKTKITSLDLGLVMTKKKLLVPKADDKGNVDVKKLVLPAWHNAPFSWTLQGSVAFKDAISLHLSFPAVGSLNAVVSYSYDHDVSRALNIMGHSAVRMIQVGRYNATIHRNTPS